MDATIEIITKDNYTEEKLEKVVSFLYEYLDQYGDDRKYIRKAVDYAMAKDGRPGGFIVHAEENGETVGAVVINKTGMGGYIPENILVYIAVHRNQRGKGMGKKLMQSTIDNSEGDIALHVEKDNPAKFLYEKVGFTNPYLEMRWKR